MPRKVVKLRRPEGGAEHELVLHEHHRCSQGNALKFELGEEVDLLQFAVGLAGWEMPLDIPFPVFSTDECHACGAVVGLYFEWTGGHVIETRRSSPLWTP